MMLHNLLPFRRIVSGNRYGFELEVEGRSYPSEDITNWEAKGDGSLGPNGVEFVTRQAFGPDKFELMLGRLSDAFSSARTRLECSVACSCHVHMNVQDLTLKQIAQILTTYYIVEEILCDFAGPDRAGNLFCLRLLDSDLALEGFMNTLNSGNIGSLSGLPRYTAVNLNSLARFGTLEFRAFRGIKEDPRELKVWADMLNSIRVFALSYRDPSEILAEVSLEGPESFFNKIFEDEEHKRLLRPFFSEDRVMDGVRRCQWLAYNTDFSRVERKRGGRF